MNIKEMTREEQIKAFNALQSELGWYPVFCLCVEDIKDYIHENNINADPEDVLAMPDDEAIHDACRYVMRKFDTDACSHAFDWAVELAVKESQE